MVLGQFFIGNIFGNGVFCAGSGYFLCASSGFFPKRYSRSKVVVGDLVLPGSSCTSSVGPTSWESSWLCTGMIVWFLLYFECFIRA